MGIVDTMIHEAKVHNAKKVKEIYLKIGEMSNIDSQILVGAIEDLKDPNLMDDLKVYATIEKNRFKCRNCGREWNFSEIEKNIEKINVDGDTPLHYLPDSAQIFIECPYCGSHEFDMYGETGVVIEKIVLEVNE